MPASRRGSIHLLVALLPLACAHVAPLPPAAARFRAATGGAAWSRVNVIESRGVITQGGMTGTLDASEDIPTGRTHVEATFDTITLARGFDGRNAWLRTRSGDVMVPDTKTAVARARTDAWLTRRGYLTTRGARWRDGGRRDDAGHAYDVLEVTPDGGVPIELWFDDADGMLARTVRHIGERNFTSIFSDYRAVSDVRVPFVTVIDDGDERDRVTITLSEVHVEAARPETAWARPAETGQIAFHGGAQRTEVPFELVNNHIYIQAAVDGLPVRVLVDTGGQNLLDKAAAQRLGVDARGRLGMGGAGDKRIDASVATAHSLTIGDLEMTDPVFFVIDIAAMGDVEGIDADGLVGYQIFHRLGVTIDYPARRIVLTAPDAFTPPAGAIGVPFETEDKMPIVDGAIDGLPARFAVDTGARNSLTVHGPFNRAHDLAAHYHAAFEAIFGWGVGGAVRGKPVRVGAVGIGKAVVHGAIADLFTGDKGAFANPDIDGNLGGGALRRFVVAFDYPHHMMYLSPGPDAAAADPYDRAGLFLLRAGDALRVAGVTPGGPAESAGLQADDRILTIDGEPAAAHSLADWRARFASGAVGTKLVLSVDRAGQHQDLTLTLRDLIP